MRTYKDVLYVPNESVHAGIDSVPFVYTRDGRKQIVVLGESNGRNIIIEQGLEAGKDIWLSIPENPEKFNLAGQELIQVIREKEREIARLEEERLLNFKKQKEFAAVSEDEPSGMGARAEGN